MRDVITHPSGLGWRAIMALQSIQDAVIKRQNDLNRGSQTLRPRRLLLDRATEIQVAEAEVDARASTPVIGKVGILGAGAAGLYAAMILESVGIEYEIIEAQEFPGGRLHTHYFQQNPGRDGNHGYQYYDVGAMRYPDIPIMSRTFDLFRRVNFTSAPGGRLIPYYLDSETGKQPQLYNNIQWPGSWTNPAPEPPPGSDYFQVGVENGGTVPQDDMRKGVDALLEGAFGKYKEELRRDWKAGWKLLMGVDAHSTRAYLGEPFITVEEGAKVQVLPGLDYNFHTIQWCETMDSATGLYDEAFSESIMDSLDFGWPLASREGGLKNAEEAVVDWKCIRGGSSALVKAMVAKISAGKIKYNRRVTRIAGVQDTTDPSVILSVNVDVTDGSFIPTIPRGDEPKIEREKYDYVLSSLPLSVLAEGVDTTHAGLDYAQQTAVRSLHYDGSVKVGIRFRKQWWRQEPYLYRGGRSSTDKPIRTCVYPSYGQDETQPDSPGVLIASYTWAQDAFRIGCMVRGSDFATKTYPNGPEDDLIEMVFRDLAGLHLIDIQTLRDLYIEHYAHNWYEDPAACGAFALFGPGQFSKMYPAVIRPAGLNPRLHLIGEATSVHHAWVVGSLNSAWRGIYNILKVAGVQDDDPRMQQLMTDPKVGGDKCWGPPPEELFLPGRRHGPLPDLPELPGRGFVGGPQEGPNADWWNIFTPARARLGGR